MTRIGLPIPFTSFGPAIFCWSIRNVVFDTIFHAGRNGDELAVVAIGRVHDGVGGDRHAQCRVVVSTAPLRVDAGGEHEHECRARDEQEANRRARCVAMVVTSTDPGGLEDS